jgi:uncharacterized protein
MSAPPAIASPCIRVCTLDPSGRACIGCLRTVDEIAGWGSYTDEQRSRVIAAIPERHRRLEGIAAPLPMRRCSQCGLAFGCGAGGPHNACWCTRYPAVEPREGQSCLCPGCLAAAGGN